MWFFNLIIFFYVAYIIGRRYVRHKYSFFAARNVTFVQPKLPFGNFQGVRTKVSFTTLLAQFYLDNVAKNVKVLGLYIFLTPTLIILDLELVKTILVRDFNYFHDRGLFLNEKDDPLSGHIFAQTGERWRNLRTKLSPAFTSGKMKMMFPMIVTVTEELEKALRVSMVVDCEIDMWDFLARFTTDVIGTCAFGLNCNSLKDPDSEFRSYGKRIVQPKISNFRRVFASSFPDLARKLRITVTEKEVETFFIKIVRDTIDHRETNNVQRNDFMSSLIQLKNHEDPINRLTIEEIVAQCFIFFFAGFETSSTTMSLTLYELAQNQKVQNKARKCVMKVLEQNGGQMTYEAMKEMSYLEQCIKETLRKYPPVESLSRVTSKDYTLPGTNFIMPKGMLVFIPIKGFHHNPEFFPNPEVYDPERFDPEQKTSRDPYTYLPFGEGPRNCIGMRFGMMQAQIGLALILRSFRFEVSEKAKVPLKFSTKTKFLNVEGGVWLSVQKV